MHLSGFGHLGNFGPDRIHRLLIGHPEFQTNNVERGRVWLIRQVDEVGIRGGWSADSIAALQPHGCGFSRSQGMAH